MKNKAILGALALDLKRVANGYYRGSDKVAERFLGEALRRKDEIDKKELKPYLIKLLNQISNIAKEDKSKAAEDALLYSTLFQNAA